VLVLIVEVVAPVLQAYVTAPVPPLGVAVRTAEIPEQTSALLTETVGRGFTFTVIEELDVQPLESVTVTVYVVAPAGEAVGFAAAVLLRLVAGLQL
jgi:hypothetical protein